MRSASGDDPFFYVYGILHSLDYRTTFEADLKKSLPHIPMADDAAQFWWFASAGRELSKLHTEFESLEPWPSLHVSTPLGFDPTYGFSLGDAQNQVCGGQDRQLHTTPTNFLWNGFFLPGGSWTQTQAVAGGWYDGQPFARVGKFTSAQGTIRTPGPVAPQVSGGDCGSYSVYGFILDNYTAYADQKAIGGDSGGPLLLAYFGSWYLAGTTSGQGVVGGIADGVSAWRDVPWPWTPCTLSAPCGTLF